MFFFGIETGSNITKFILNNLNVGSKFCIFFQGSIFGSHNFYCCYYQQSRNMIKTYSDDTVILSANPTPVNPTSSYLSFSWCKKIGKWDKTKTNAKRIHSLYKLAHSCKSTTKYYRPLLKYATSNCSYTTDLCTWNPNPRL